MEAANEERYHRQGMENYFHNNLFCQVSRDSLFLPGEKDYEMLGLTEPD